MSTQIDLLRVFAACSIFYYHVGLCTKWPLSQWGEYGVGTFIYLTSYCALRFSKPQAWPDYICSRLKKIYPTFATITLILFAASYIYRPHKTMSHYTIPGLLANLGMIAQYTGVPLFTTPMWFMPFLFQIYFIIPFLKRRPIGMGFIPLGFIFSGIACGAVWTFQPADATEVSRNWSPIFRLPEVLIGVVLASSKNISSTEGAVGLYAIFCLFSASLAIPYPHASYTALLPARDLLVFLILFILTRTTLALLKSEQHGFLSLLGRATFPFFLLSGVGNNFVWIHFGSNLLAWIPYFMLCWGVSMMIVVAGGAIRPKLRSGHRREPLQSNDFALKK